MHGGLEVFESLDGRLLLDFVINEFLWCLDMECYIVIRIVKAKAICNLLQRTIHLARSLSFEPSI
jgi:hypothetical protein